MRSFTWRQVHAWRLSQHGLSPRLARHRFVEAATRIEDEGFAAVVLPAPRGSIAVVGRNVPGIELIAHEVFSAVEWEA